MGRHARLATLADIQTEGLVVADLGCGDGRTVRKLLGHDPSPGLVYALDQAASLPDALLHDERVRSRIADLDEPLPFEDASIDRVVSLNVIEALADPAGLPARVPSGPATRAAGPSSRTPTSTRRCSPAPTTR